MLCVPSDIVLWYYILFFMKKPLFNDLKDKFFLKHWCMKMYMVPEKAHN